jgi:hypothetical protein
VGRHRQDRPRDDRRQGPRQVASLSAEASGLGIQLDDATLQQMANDSLRLGWNDAQTRAAIGSAALKNPALISQTTYTKYKQMASDYGVGMTNDGLNYWVDQGIRNGNDNGFLDQMRAAAKSLYPSIAKAIDQGTTVAQYFDPYKQLAASTLELNPNQVDLSDPKWQRAIMAPQPDGSRVPMSMYQWQTTMRTDPIYGYDKTKQAKDQAYSIGNGILQKFGMVSS